MRVLTKHNSHFRRMKLINKMVELKNQRERDARKRSRRWDDFEGYESDEMEGVVEEGEGEEGAGPAWMMELADDMKTSLIHLENQTIVDKQPQPSEEDE